MLGFKAARMDIKAVSQDGVFEGYLSRFNEEDLEEDVVKPGAFTRTLTVDKGQGVGRRPLLWQHSSWEVVGVLDAKQDDQGLFIQGHLNLEVQRAREAHSLLKQRALSGLSQGFRTIRYQARPNNRGRFLEELDLWEGSLATFPALPSAQILSVRSALPPSWLARIEQDAADEQRATVLRGLASIAHGLRAPSNS